MMMIITWYSDNVDLHGQWTLLYCFSISTRHSKTFPYSCSTGKTALATS